MSVRVFYLIGNSTFVQQPAHKAWKNTSRRCPHFRSPMGESTSDQWNPHTKDQQCEKRPSCISRVEHVYLCVFNITERQIIRNSDHIWASWDFAWLATLIVCSTSHIGKMKQKNLKFRITDRLRGEPTDDQWSRHTKGQQCDKWPVYQNTCDICQNTTEIQRSRKYRWKFKKKHRQPR